MTHERNESRPVAAEDRPWIERLGAELDPGPVTPARRVELERALETDAARRPRLWLAAPALAAAAALALALAWLAPGLRDAGPLAPPSTASAAPGLLAYAYYETDYLDDAAEADDEDFLPESYVAIAALFDVP